MKLDYRTELIGRLISYPDGHEDIERALDRLEEHHFRDERHKFIIKLFKQMLSGGKPLNMISAYHEAQRHMSEEKAQKLVAYLGETVASYQFTPLVDCVRMVLEDHVRGKLRHLGERMHGDGVAEQIGEYQKALAELDTEQHHVDAVDHAMQALVQRQEPLGFRTGINFFDSYTKRLKKGHLWVIGAYAKTGKTQLATQMLEHVHRLPEKPKVCFFSLEMSPEEIIERVLRYKQQSRKISENIALDEMLHHPFQIVGHLYSINAITNYIKEHKPDIVFIDYMQILQHGEKSIFEGMNEVSRRLKLCAKQNDCCIVALSQVSNEQNKSKSMAAAGFKGSGDILANCDVGIFLIRNFDEEKDNAIVPMEIIIRANRHGKQGGQGFTFDKQSGIITENDY